MYGYMSSNKNKNLEMPEYQQRISSYRDLAGIHHYKYILLLFSDN